VRCGADALPTPNLVSVSIVMSSSWPKLIAASEAWSASGLLVKSVCSRSKPYNSPVALHASSSPSV